MSDLLIRGVLTVFGLACVGTEVYGAYEALWEKFGRWNYLVIGGILVTSLAAVLPMAAERAWRNRQYGWALVSWLAVPLTLIFVFTAAIQRTGTAMDLDEAGRQHVAASIVIAKQEIAEATEQLKTDKAAVKANCDVWGPVCTKARAAQEKTEVKLTAARAVLKTRGVEIDDSVAKRIVTYMPWLTKEQVLLYQPMLLPLALAVLGSICIGIGVRGNRGDKLPKKEKVRMWSWMRRRRAGEVKTPEPASAVTEPVTAPKKLSVQPAPKLVSVSKGPPAGPIGRIMTAALEPAKGKRADLEECYGRYIVECRREGREPVSAPVFMDAMAKFCSAAGIKHRFAGEKLLLLDVQLVSSETRKATIAS